MCLQYKSFGNTVGKEEIAHYEQFLLFPQCFQSFRELSVIFIKFKIVVCNFFLLWKSLNFIVWERVKTEIYLHITLCRYLFKCTASLRNLKTGYEVHLIGQCWTGIYFCHGFSFFAAIYFPSHLIFLSFFAWFDINLSKGAATDSKPVNLLQIKSLLPFHRWPGIIISCNKQWHASLSTWDSDL